MAIEIGFFIAPVILGCALVYGIMQNRRKNPANAPITDAATRKSFEDPEAYARVGEGEMREEVKPSR